MTAPFCRSARSPLVLGAEKAEEGRQMNPQYVEMASLLMVWGGFWLRDGSTRAVYPLKSLVRSAHS